MKKRALIKAIAFLPLLGIASLGLPAAPLVAQARAATKLGDLDCTPQVRHDNFCDRLISRMTCGSKSEKPSVSDVVQIEGDQAR